MRHQGLKLCSFGLLVQALSGVALGQLPPDQTVYFKLRTTPTNPASAVYSLITMHLAAAERSADYVGWRVTQVVVQELAADGAVTGHWSGLEPDVSTSDGLWWIRHTDPTQPVLSEFVRVPLVTGKAPATDPRFDDLEFSVSGSPYFSPGSQPPFTNTVALTYSLRMLEAQEPIHEGDDEPVESGGVRDMD